MTKNAEVRALHIIMNNEHMHHPYSFPVYVYRYAIPSLLIKLMSVLYSSAKSIQYTQVYQWCILQYPVISGWWMTCLPSS